MHDKAAGYVLLMVFLVLATGQIRGLADGKVLFLYEEDTESIAFAQEHKEKPVVYFYNPNLTWMIWDDSLELMQYDEIYLRALQMFRLWRMIQSGRRIRCLYMFPEWSRLRRRCRLLQMEWAVM